MHKIFFPSVANPKCTPCDRQMYHLGYMYPSLGTPAIGKYTANGKTWVVRKFSAEEHMNKIRKLQISFAPRCQWTRGNLPARSA